MQLSARLRLSKVVLHVKYFYDCQMKNRDEPVVSKMTGWGVMSRKEYRVYVCSERLGAYVSCDWCNLRTGWILTWRQWCSDYMTKTWNQKIIICSIKKLFFPWFLQGLSNTYHPLIFHSSHFSFYIDDNWID